MGCFVQVCYQGKLVGYLTHGRLAKVRGTWYSHPSAAVKAAKKHHAADERFTYRLEQPRFTVRTRALITTYKEIQL